MKIVLVCWFLLVIFPTPPFVFGTGADASWYYGINIAHAKHLVFGTDVMYTVGPLGYLTVPVPGFAEKNITLAFILATYFIALYGLFRCMRKFRFEETFVTAVVTAVLVLYPQHYADNWLGSCFPLFLSLAVYSSFETVDFAIAGVLAGITFLIKFNDGLLFCAIYCCLVCFGYLERRKGGGNPLGTLLILAAVPIATVEAGVQMLQGDLLSSFQYLKSSLAIAAGYSEAMSASGPGWQLGLAVLTIGFMFAHFVFAAKRSTTWLRCVVPSLIVAFIAFKHGMVRQDGHADLTQAKLAIPALFIMVGCVTLADRRTYALLAAFCALLTVVIASESKPWIGDLAANRWMLTALPARIDAIVHFDQTWDTRRIYFDSQLATLKLNPRFDLAVAKNETLDVFSNDIDSLMANGWADQFKPRPVFQSFVAYLPQLDALNATHLAGTNGPDLVLVKFGTIDGRHPFVEDPASWRALFDRYEVRVSDPTAILLQRRKTSRFEKPELISDSIANLGAEIRVPPAGDHEIVIASIDIQHSYWGTLRTLFFRGSPLLMQVKFTSGTGAWARAMRPNLIEGAIVNPFPGNLDDLAAMFRGDEPSTQVASIIFYGSPLEMRSPFHISWYRWHVSLAASAFAKKLPNPF